MGGIKAGFLFYILLFSLTVLTCDFLSARYGKGVIFERHVKLPFKFYVEQYETKFDIWSVVGEFPLIHSGYYFPTGAGNGNASSKDEVIFVNNILAYSTSGPNLFVLTEGVNKKKSIIKISSVQKDGVVNEYEIIEKTKSNYFLEKLKWRKLDKKFSVILQLKWKKIFWILNILNVILIFFLIRKKR